MKKPQGLCYRCEHRAVANEFGNGPRYECNQTSMNVASCYMYLPVKPITLGKDDPTDPRSVYDAPLFAARTVVADKQLELQLRLGHDDGDNHVRYWEPK